MNSKIWLSSPHIGGSEQRYIKEAFDSNWVAPIGLNIDHFEDSLQSYIGEDKRCVALNSGSSAIHLALVLLGVSVGSEVLCQSFTFVASANPILYLGATPIFIDSEKETWNICPIELEKCIIERISKGKNLKAIIVTHSYGMPYKADQLNEVSEKYNIPIIEDAASALGSSFKNQQCGTFGNFGVFSFNGNKIITTSSGGALICNSDKEKEKAIFLATQARDNAPHYQHSEVGYNYRMSNICAGIGRGQMEVLGKHIQFRREMHQFYIKLFRKIGKVSVFKEPSPDFHSNFWLSAILLESFEKREALRLHLERDNIESRPLWKPMHLQPIFNKYPFYGGYVAEQLFEKGLCLPSGSNLTIIEKDGIKRSITSFFKA